MSEPVEHGPVGPAPDRREQGVGGPVLPVQAEGSRRAQAGRRHTLVSRYPVVGLIALGLATLTALTVGVAVSLAATGGFAIGTLLGYVAIALSAAAVVLGVVAAVANRGRRIGIAAAVVGVLANPLVLLVTLRLLAGGD